MISFNDSFSSFSIARLLPMGSFASSKKRYLYWLCAFGLLMAALEFGQDYISSVLNGNYFSLSQSLSYKLFWLLFVPFSLLLVYALEQVNSKISRAAYFAGNALLIPILTLTHLLVFALLLFGISSLLYAEPWSLPVLITEKLSTRLYIGLSVYIVFSVIYYLLRQMERNSPEEKPEYSNNIIVKNGQSTTVLDVDDISWIGSDGPYLFINTSEKKHVKLDSLKNIISTLPENFRRVHRSTIVNIDKVCELNSRGNGDYDIIMESGKKLRLSRNYTKPLKGLLL